jgi:hypothetical protein
MLPAMTGLVDRLLPEALWQRIQPLLPAPPRRRGIRPRIARRMIEPSDRLGRHRWTIERTGAWLSGWRRLRIRYERDSERFYALVLLACLTHVMG